MPQRPHIVIFNPDEWRWDVMGHMGNPAAVTPNLDRLVQNEAVSFSHAFCQNPVCVPSRCSFMSGWYPHTAGHRTMQYRMQPGEPVLLKALKDNGYHVYWSGKNHLVPPVGGTGDVPAGPEYCHDHHIRSPENMPIISAEAWDEVRGDPKGNMYYSHYQGKADLQGKERFRDRDWDDFEAGIDFVKNGMPGDKPICLYLPLFYPHPPFGCEEPWYSIVDRTKLPPRRPVPENWEGKPSLIKEVYRKANLIGLSDEQWNEIRATYYGMCARVDHQFGILVDTLKEVGIYDDTALFFFSDHGDYVGDYDHVSKAENMMEDCLTRVPFIIKPPKDMKVAPRVSDAMVELIDFPATVEALTGIEPEHTHFGRSLLPLVAGETDEHRDAAFCEGGSIHGEDHCQYRNNPARDDPWGPYWPLISTFAADGPAHTKAVMCRTHDFKYVRRLYESDELYDLRNDPEELHNRIDDPALADVLARLKDRMLTWFIETGDAVPHETDRR